jgi:AbrB family looped-hinge helix DNA binding protein
MQITIPKKLARNLSIEPGDAVVFDEVGRDLVVKKVGRKSKDYTELRRSIELFAQDIPKVRKYVKFAERSMVENLSRHIRSK